MAALLKYWREAASLIIISPSNSITRSTGAVLQRKLNPPPSCNNHLGNSDSVTSVNIDIQDSEYETLLLKRSSKSKFMPNVYVFPGGAADNDDFSEEWISVFQKLGKDFQKLIFDKVSRNSDNATTMFTRKRDSQFSQIPPDVAFRLCAIRETFEESGILIAKNLKELKNQSNISNNLIAEKWNLSSSLISAVDSNLNLIEWRERVNKDPSNFLRMCKEYDLIPDILSLYEWTQWLTPSFMGGKRFDTIFYVCCLENKPETKEDSRETVHYQWVSPSAITTGYYTNSQKVSLATPQVYELTRMLNFSTAEQLMSFAAQREAERVEQFYPIIAFSSEGKVISLMPGDDLYPTDPDFYTPKHKMMFDESMEELDSRVKHFHRSVHGGVDFEGNVVNIVSNVDFGKRRHVGPVMVKLKHQQQAHL